jgi:hypothetical protein
VEEPIGPFRKSFADVYEWLGLGVIANGACVLAFLGAVALGSLVLRGPAWAPPVVWGTGLLVTWPALAWGFTRLSIAMARRDEPAPRLLFSGFGRSYPSALAYASVSLVGAVAVGFMVLFWSAAPVWGSPVEPAIAGLWVGLGAVGILAHTLGWPVLVLTEGRVCYSLRVGLALLAVRPIVSLGYALWLAAEAGLLGLPFAVAGQGVAAGLGMMFVLFLGLFATSVVTTNVALHLLAVVRTRKEGLGGAPNCSAPSEEEEADAGSRDSRDPRG